MNFLVCRLAEIETGIQVQTPYVLISISGVGEPTPEPQANPLCREVLSLQFDDAKPTAEFRLRCQLG